VDSTLSETRTLSSFPDKTGKKLVVCFKGEKPGAGTEYELSPARRPFWTLTPGRVIEVGHGYLSTPDGMQRRGNAEELIRRLHEVVFPALSQKTGLTVIHRMDLLDATNTPMLNLAKKLGFKGILLSLGGWSKKMSGSPKEIPTTEEQEIVSWLERKQQ
jgi:hypothetical protein